MYYDVDKQPQYRRARITAITAVVPINIYIFTTLLIYNIMLVIKCLHRREWKTEREKTKEISKKLMYI